MMCSRESAPRASAGLPAAIIAILLLPVAGLVAPAPAAAQTCGFTAEHTPATPAPSDLWSGLEPTDLGGLPTSGANIRDTTWFDRNGGYSITRPIWQSVDAENGYLFTALNLGIQVWDATTAANAADPQRLSVVDVRSAAPIIFRNPHNYFIVGDIDAPPGNDDLLAMVGWEGMGTIIWDVSNKGNPTVLYQDGGTQNAEKKGSEVYAATIGGRHYAFAASYDFNGGVWVYDMTKAQTTGFCIEQRPSVVNPACNGIFKSRITTAPQRHVGGAGNLLAFSGGLASASGFEIWNVANPANPVQRMVGLPGRFVHGVAMWEQGVKTYLAVAARFPDQGLIYDVTTCTSGSCTLPAPKYSFPIPGVLSSQILSVTASQSGGTPYVYFGRKDSPNIDDLQGEWLLDVSGIASGAVIAVTGGNPQNGNSGQPTRNEQGTTVGYWSWYYACSPQGSNHLQPRAGVVHDGYFYRAGSSIFDVHRLGNVQPRITVTAGTSQGYAGDPVPFSAAASACTPVSNGWSWSTNGGTLVSGGTSATPQISWATTGTKTVSATNTGCPGAEVVSDSVQIVDPAPLVGSVAANISNALVCQAITFEASGVSGRPPLDFDWEILDDLSVPLVPQPALDISPNGQSATWDTSAGTPPAAGDYRGRLTVTNSAGSDAATSPLVSLAQPAPLAFNGPGGAPTASISFGSVDFDAQSQGAAQWCWTFGDGTPEQCSTDPVGGPTPSHEYNATGTYQVTVEISNCIEPDPLVSAPLEVVITEVSPLEIITFRAQCPFGVCSFTTADNITFTHQVEGDPNFYDYDWDGDGDYEDNNNTSPVTSHRYTTAGTYQPVLRVRRGSQSDIFTHVLELDVTTGGGSGTPRLTITGPTTGTVGQNRNFVATPANCTPTSYSWNTGGGSGNSTTGSIGITWNTTGTKTISVTAAGCGTASDSHSITISGGGGGGGGEVGANFVYTPSAPVSGQQISFNGNSSTGNPEEYLWDFGDGSTATTAVAAHTYTAPGSYQVSLTVSKEDPECNQFGQNICTDTETQTVTVTGEASGNCVADAETLCLLDGRFQVTARFHNPSSGNIVPAKVYTPFSADKTGMFWFFRQDNVELIVKTLDGRPVNNAFWVFYGGLSNVEYWIEVVDTENAENDETVEYHNEPGVICGVPDTEAFPQEAEAPQASSALRAVPMQVESFSLEPIAGAVSGTCVPGADTLCLLDGRFSVEVEWTDQRSGDSGVGNAIRGTDRTGYFWFFNSQNIELVTKMIDATESFGYFWVLWGGLSDVEYTIRVTDTVADVEREFHNPPGSFCGGADTTAFE